MEPEQNPVGDAAATAGSESSQDPLAAALRENETLKEQARTAAAELEALRLNSAVELALERSGARNQKAVRALLKTEDLRYQDGVAQGLDEQLAQVRREAPYLFADATAAPSYRPAGGVTVPDTSRMTDDEYYRYMNRHQ